MNYKYTLLLFIALFSISCGKTTVSRFENATIVENKDFTTEKLKGEMLSLDPIWNPEQLYLSDSILFLVNRSGQPYVQTFNLKNNKLLTENVISGPGPNEFTSCSGLLIDKDNNNVTVCDLQSQILKRFDYSSFISQSHITPSWSLQLEATPMGLRLLPGQKYMCAFAMKFNSLVNIIDSTGKSTDLEIPFPNISDFTYDDFEKKFAFGITLLYNYIDNKIVLAYRTTDVIDVYDEKCTLLRRIHGPEHFYPEPNEKNIKMSYNHSCATSKYIYALYCGHYRSDNCEGDNIIYVYDYDLKPIVKYELDIPIFKLAVDEDARIIYGLSDNPERCVVKYGF